MSRTYRKHPHGVELHPHPTRDGIAWHMTPAKRLDREPVGQRLAATTARRALPWRYTNA